MSSALIANAHKRGVVLTFADSVVLPSTSGMILKALSMSTTLERLPACRGFWRRVATNARTTARYLGRVGMAAGRDIVNAELFGHRKREQRKCRIFV